MKSLTSRLTKLVRRHGTIVAYLVLAAFVAYAFSIERTHSNENRERVAAATHTVLINGCVRGNQLRAAIRSILQVAVTPAPGQNVSQRQQSLALAFYRDAAGKLHPIDCVKAYPEPK